MNDPFKPISPLGNTASKKPSQQGASFLESIREQGSSLPGGIAHDAMDQLFGPRMQRPSQMPSPDSAVPQRNPDNNGGQPPFNFAEFLKLREQRIRQQERNLAQQQHHTETIIFHQKEQKAKEEIEFIKAEIKKIIDTTQEVSTELIAAEQAVMTNTVEAGTYQINFFQRIRNLIILARKSLSESKNWLDLMHSRNSQRSFYWGQVQKSGGKFMLSAERYMTNQAG